MRLGWVVVAGGGGGGMGDDEQQHPDGMLVRYRGEITSVVVPTIN